MTFLTPPLGGFFWGERRPPGAGCGADVARVFRDVLGAFIMGVWYISSGWFGKGWVSWGDWRLLGGREVPTAAGAHDAQVVKQWLFG